MLRCELGLGNLFHDYIANLTDQSSCEVVLYYELYPSGDSINITTCPENVNRQTLAVPLGGRGGNGTLPDSADILWLVRMPEGPLLVGCSGLGAQHQQGYP